MRNKFVAVLVLFALLLAVPSVFATVDWNPDTGTGTVGKGDIQSAFGWNNAQLQQNAAGVTFTKHVENPYLLECVTDTGEVIYSQPGVRVYSFDLVSEVVYNKNQVTGFKLMGIGSGGGGGAFGCAGANPRVTWYAPTTSLYANYGGVSVKLA